MREHAHQKRVATRMAFRAARPIGGEEPADPSWVPRQAIGILRAQRLRLGRQAVTNGRELFWVIVETVGEFGIVEKNSLLGCSGREFAHCQRLSGRRRHDVRERGIHENFVIVNIFRRVIFSSVKMKRYSNRFLRAAFSPR